ncbi:hypothetical protein [Paenibacillus sp. HB172176]|uniref:hypothetical protein n=1 Tax=Paenibacillus sp. HB172176 TaxID=2493690 RepID=UPI00143A82FE|nr:hypothetical protein [Paenibacillus sp. HB172176]
MNISQMMRGLLGDSTSGETKSMELKPGQIVRGVVLQTTENNEAIVQINGVKVSAKLELPLKAGQSAMLQVQPESSGGLVVLKAVDLGDSGALDDTFRDIARGLGLPDQKWSLDIVRDLRKEGFLFDRTTAAAFKQAAAAMPKGANLEQWMMSAAAAFKRGMPMTATTIASMQQVMFGKPAHELLESLQQLLGQMLAGASEKGAETPPPQAALASAAKVSALLQQGAALMSGATEASGEGMEARAAAAANKSSAAQALPQASTGAVNQTQSLTRQPAAEAEGARLQQAAQPDSNRQAGVSPANANQTNQANPQLAGSAAGVEETGSDSGNWLKGMMKWLGVDHELQLAKAATSADAPVRAAEAGNNGAASAGQATREGTEAGASKEANALASQENRSRAGGASEVRTAQAHPVPTNGTAPQEGISKSGSGNAAVPANQHGANAGASPSGEHAMSMQAGQPQTHGAVPEGLQQLRAAVPGPGGPLSLPLPEQLHTQEGLKSALMTLASGSDTPGAVKETATQLLHHITGQQLLLAPERNSSIFTHVTMLIPLKDREGGSTASVHIQTRRGRKGELDSENCRLLFQLSMETLGETMVDVNVTDRIVSLNVWNDHPAMTAIIDSAREDISARMHAAGYQLFSLRATPLPKEDVEGAMQAAGVKRQALPDTSQFASTRYKGVDYRI